MEGLYMTIKDSVVAQLYRGAKVGEKASLQIAVEPERIAYNEGEGFAVDYSFYHLNQSLSVYNFISNRLSSLIQHRPCASLSGGVLEHTRRRYKQR
ncbi:unnamed protein product [Lactuca virosa]|uniref:Uncharacterized protein n=1 Tax=Lactuca virosa TaxID=75947 RepID=A0AAU9NJV5_9ASTR|nr:unnamed protein product [Lactuca virosa]